jgi:hypothetical protein
MSSLLAYDPAQTNTGTCTISDNPFFLARVDRLVSFGG